MTPRISAIKARLEDFNKANGNWCSCCDDSALYPFINEAPSDIAYLLEACRIYREALDRLADDALIDRIAISRLAIEAVDALEGK